MRDRGQHDVGVPWRWSAVRQGELVAAGHLATVALAVDQPGPPPSPAACGSPPVRLPSAQMLCRSAGVVAAALIHAVEALGVAAGIVVQLQVSGCRRPPACASPSRPPRSPESILFVSRCLCGSSKQWSHSVTLPDRSSCLLHPAKTRSSGRFAAPTRSCKSACCVDRQVGVALRRVGDHHLAAAAGVCLKK